MNAGFNTIATMLKAKSGLTLGPDKLYLMETRLVSIMRRENARDLAALAEKHACQFDRSSAKIVEAMTTNESLFFRDTKPFDALRAARAAAPARRTARRARVCASGLRPPPPARKPTRLPWFCPKSPPSLGDRKIDILGTDIARDALKRGREGVYSQFEIQRGLPMQMLVQIFRQGRPAMAHQTRACALIVEFREWNLLADLRALGQFDVIFCRNVLIYFDAPTKSRVLEALATPVGARWCAVPRRS